MTTFSKPHTERVQQLLADYLSDSVYTHFLTIRVPYTTHSLARARSVLRKLTMAFQYRFLGRWWHKHHLEFVAVAELGETKKYHFHLLLKATHFSTYQLRRALNATCVDLRRLPLYTFKVKKITRTRNRLAGYCVKEIEADRLLRFNSDVVIYSGELFFPLGK